MTRGTVFLTGLFWLFLAGAICLLSAYRLKTTFITLLSRAFGPRVGLALYAFVTLPGFFLHEGAHALAAFLLRVPILDATLIPRPSMDGMAVGAAVQVARRDPLRMALVALAPLVAGTVALGLLTGLLGNTGTGPWPWLRLQDWVVLLNMRGADFWAGVYVIWSISSHMGPSSADMRYVWSGGAILLVLLAAAGLLLSRAAPAAPDAIGNTIGRVGDGLAAGALLNIAILLPVEGIAFLTRRR